MTISMPRMDRLPAQERGVTIGDFLVPIRVSERLHNRARHLALILLGTAIIAAQRPGLHPHAAGARSRARRSASCSRRARSASGAGLLATLLYLALGAVGLPIFAEGKHGIEWLVGATGGYLVGFVLASAIVGRLAELGWDRNLLGSIGAMVLGSARDLRGRRAVARVRGLQGRPRGGDRRRPDSVPALGRREAGACRRGLPGGLVVRRAPPGRPLTQRSTASRAATIRR